MTANTKKPVHSFSTNFFGVLGYIGTTLIWLLVLVCLVVWVPAFQDDSPGDEIATVLFGTGSSSTAAPPHPALAFLLSVLLVIVLWAFSYVASRILSRIVKRLDGIFVKHPTITSVYKTKFIIHAVGILALALLLVTCPLSFAAQSAIILLGLFSGTMGAAALPLQHHVAKRHKVPFDRYL